MSTVRDRLWLWGHDAGSHNADWCLPEPSRITPVEAAIYMAIPNVIMVRYNEAAMPASVQYSVPFRSLDQVVWSIVGGGGYTADEDREHVIKLARDLPNMNGVMMDDFFTGTDTEDGVGTLSLDELRHIRGLLDAACRPLDLWVVLYDHQLYLPVGKHLELCDTIAFWTWEASNLVNLEANFARAEQIAPSCRKVLGCYMWDYGIKQPMRLNLMKHQCELGLRWLKEGRIDGMIFLASCICDLDLETVEWTRQWIQDVSDQTL